MTSETPRGGVNMELHPTAVALVAKLIQEGRAGEKPFGVPLQAWLAAIEKQTPQEEK